MQKNDRYFWLWFYHYFYLRSYFHFLYDRKNDVQSERKQEGKKSPIISEGKTALSYRNEALPLNYWVEFIILDKNGREVTSPLCDDTVIDDDVPEAFDDIAWYIDRIKQIPDFGRADTVRTR